ncbi:uncharacterized protein LOC128260234 [Drosophila gunungcola]|uniref:Uncharacterized protein n=1 Tax=Drosophila gunungcola TaxID=103775 RepID=A0A9P9YET3_9MUSC|nr:uncharacterized protein LOC128260234 [Drosophila gunungcola]KAI8035651.1 hypothetical protein M5D96_011564 [Drosophila gunungcola]
MKLFIAALTVCLVAYAAAQLPSSEYLPPVDNAPSQEYLPPVDAAAIGDTKVADDGYRYKTVRKLKFRARHRRDVSEIAEPSNEYLPPVEVELAPELKTVLGDGYRYKTVRRLKFRRHRREAAAEEASAEAAPNGEYLPPAEAVAAPVAAEAETKAAEEGTELAKDGYRYKTVRRLRYRHRH